MANTYHKMIIHLVFAVKGRESLLHKAWRGEVFAYISGVLDTRGHKSFGVGGHNDHIHILFSYSSKELISDLVREIKKSSVSFINNQGYLKKSFYWQRGYGAFSVSDRYKGRLVDYIRNQEAHHTDKNFKEEYHKILCDNNIQFKDEYLFDYFDQD